MNQFTLVRRSFAHYWNNHLGLLIGVFLTSAILTGSLLVGDSVRATLSALAKQRLSQIQSAVLGSDRWFSMALAQEANAAPVILSLGSASLPTGEARVNAVQVIGASTEFWVLSLEGKNQKGFGINEEMAQRLGVQVGDTLVLRMELPSLISRDAPLSGETNQEVILRKKVEFIANANQHGSFQLAASQQPVATAYVPLEELQQALGKEHLINAMLSPSDLQQIPMFAEDPEACATAVSGVMAHRLKSAMAEPKAPVPSLLDYGLSLQKIQSATAQADLRTQRVFLDEILSQKVLAAYPDSTPVLTYLVNGLSSAKGRTPYSMVTATNAVKEWVPGGLADDEVIVSQWLADDQQLAVGDAVEIRYFSVGLGREMVEKTATFKVRSILAMDDPRMEPSWTPDFPGVSEADNCRDWQPGIPVKLDAIRDKDEVYWDTYKTTPKAFLNLEAGQALWSNRFGNLTSVRFKSHGSDLESNILSHLQLKDLGLVPVALQAMGETAAKGSVDFGGLFMGLSLFLIGGALVFSALLFVFTLEKRAVQLGLLLAIGVTPKEVRSMTLKEGLSVALVGAVLGLLGGVGYTKLAIFGLNAQWKDATVGLSLAFASQPQTYVIALVATLAASWLTLRWSLRSLFRVGPKGLLVGEVVALSKQLKQKSPIRNKIQAVVWLIFAIALALSASKVQQPEMQAGLFFGAGFMVLMSGLTWISLALQSLERHQADRLDLAALGIRNIARRPSRSLSIVGILAGGLFLVIAVNAFRLNAPVNADHRKTGTGGFAFVAESTLPIYEDLNRVETVEKFAMDEALVKKVQWVPFRLREGDDASCLNLNRAQNPVLSGVNPKLLAERDAFAFVSGSWKDLASTHESIPAVADQATAMWGLGKGVGDVLTYQDAKGRSFEVKLVGLLSGSLLQGKILIPEAAFLEKYPNTAGYQYFLVDVPRERRDEIGRHLVKQLEGRGLALEASTDRLNRFYAVQNTYIGIFTLLGGLGVVLGTVGLAVLAMRNVLERRGEFALMQAVGFGLPRLRTMVLSEHLALLVLGVTLGAISAVVAIWPSLQQGTQELPYGVMAGVLVGILIVGSTVCWIAAHRALKGDLTQNLRAE